MPVKSKVEISQNFVAFSEYMNFNRNRKIKVKLWCNRSLSCHAHRCHSRNNGSENRKSKKNQFSNRNRKIQVKIPLYLFQMIKLRIPVGISSLHNCFLIGILHMTAEFLIFWKFLSSHRNVFFSKSPSTCFKVQVKEKVRL